MADPVNPGESKIDYRLQVDLSFEGRHFSSGIDGAHSTHLLPQCHDC